MVCGTPGGRARGFEEDGGKRRGRSERCVARPAERDRCGLSKIGCGEDLSARGGGRQSTYRRGIGGTAAAELSEGDCCLVLSPDNLAAVEARYRQRNCFASHSARLSPGEYSTPHSRALSIPTTCGIGSPRGIGPARCPAARNQTEAAAAMLEGPEPGGVVERLDTESGGFTARIFQEMLGVRPPPPWEDPEVRIHLPPAESLVRT